MFLDRGAVETKLAHRPFTPVRPPASQTNLSLLWTTLEDLYGAVQLNSVTPSFVYTPPFYVVTLVPPLW